jgi:A/G-specific adenine glycosylase
MVCGGPGDVCRDPLASATEAVAFGEALLDWYDAHGRDLPWRQTRDPYRVWVSEVMLQQTRVRQMEAFYARFLDRFPTLADLAAAADAEVLKAWEGLGYYARARQLHGAARQVMAYHGGALPTTRDGLLTLPGVGPYTAAAVSSIAFDRDHVVLDGNVSRVLCRLLLVTDLPTRQSVRQRLIDAGQRLLVRGRPGDFNQGLMELGARVCLPAAPHCDGCPVGAWCRARAAGADPAVVPQRRPRRPGPHLQVAAGMIWRGDRLLLAQRPAGGMLGGLWEFPGGKQEPGETLEACLRREIREELGLHITVGPEVVSVEHAYTHFRITLHAFSAWSGRGTPRALECAAWQWVDPADLGVYAMPRSDRRVIEHLVAQQGGVYPPVRRLLRCRAGGGSPPRARL